MKKRSGIYMKNTTLYEKNMEVILQSNPYLGDNIDKQDIEKQEDHIIVELVGEEKIVGIERDGYVWYLNSRFMPKKAEEVWAKSIEIKNYTTIFVILGFGNGGYIQSLRKKYPDNIFIVYEPSEILFQKVLSECDLSEILEDDNLFLSVGKKGLCLYTEYVLSLFNYITERYVEWVALPNYDQLFSEEKKEMQHIFLEKAGQDVASRNTLILYQNEWITNYYQNLWSCIASYSINELRHQIEKSGKKQKTAIIVSAGPSLDKNVKDLKKAKGHALIIVVDTALKTVLNAGIEPDLTISIDPHKPLNLFQHPKAVEVPIVVCAMSNPKLVSLMRGKKIFMGDSDDYIEKIFKNYKKNISALETGGSVANNAFSLATFLGFKTIILVGQDLAYPNNQMHTKDAYEDKTKDTMEKGKKYVEVEDVFGGKVLTEGNMNAYRKWFERQIARYPHLHVIDATEGGAKIHGCEILTLKEAIQRECQKEYSVDYQKIISNMRPNFTERQKEKIRARLESIGNRLDYLEKRIQNGKRLYNQLEKEGGKEGFSLEKIKKIVEKIERLTSWLEKNAEMKLVEMYNYHIEYMLQERVYDVGENTQEEFRMIAKEGLLMYDTYLNAISSIKKDIKNIDYTNL